MFKGLFVRSTLIGLFCSLSFIAEAFGDPAIQIDVPAGDLGLALAQLAKQFGVEFIYRADQVRGVRTDGARGTYTAHDAVQLLLKGTSLELRTDPSGAMLIAPPRAKPTSQNTNDGAGGSEYEKSSLSQLAQVSPPPRETSLVEVKEEEKARGETAKQHPELQEVVVTGTHIRGSANATAPVLVLDRAEIDKSGYTTTEQLVSSLPQNFGGGPSAGTPDGFLSSGNFAQENLSNATAVNLRGLGASSTLVLIDGHRVAPAAEGLFVDVSQIPLAAVDRVEIMTDGASAVYGSDAVGGVVNFILRKNYDGQETWGSFGGSTGRGQGLLGQAVGRDWTGGGVLATFQFQDLGALSAADRPFTSGATPPTDVLPSSKKYSALLSAHQDLGAGFNIDADLLFSHAEGHYQFAESFQQQGNSPASDQGDGTVTIGYTPAEKWRLELSGTYSRDHTALTFLEEPAPSACGTGPCHYLSDFHLSNVELKADGTLASVPGGDLKGAIGLSYRTEDYNFEYIEEPPEDHFRRTVSAEYVELEVPIFGTPNSQTLLRELSASLAVRHDQYSDFGSTINPRIGLSWHPFDGLHIRGAHSTSFRAPNAFEELAADAPAGLGEVPEPSPSGAGAVPVFFRYGGGGPPLQPEKSRNSNAGLDFDPVPELKLSIDYWNVRYSHRIEQPSFEANALAELNVYGSLIGDIGSDAAARAYVAQFLTEGGQVVDCVTNGCGGPGPLTGTGVRYLFNGFEQNAALVRESGIDISIVYKPRVADNNFNLMMNMAYIRSIETSYTTTSSPTDVVNTYANPLRLRARGSLGWNRGRWSVNTALNFSGKYVDTTTNPFATIASWTTIDAQLAYSIPFAKYATVSLSALNMMNRYPPYVVGTNQLDNAIHYDVGNADPLGRLITLSARIGW